jgi:hypothetical protein
MTEPADQDSGSITIMLSGLGTYDQNSEAILNI